MPKKIKYNPADRIADLAMIRIQDRVKSVYEEAQKDITKKLDEFMKRFKARDAMYQAKVAAGEIAKADYDAWRRCQIFQGERWKIMKQEMADQILKANRTAAGMINDERRVVFQNNANYAAFQIEKKTKGAASFGLYDSATVTRLLKEDRKLLPEYKINAQKDYKWNNRHVNNAVTQSIIQGESIDKLTKRLTDSLEASNRSTMMNFARTAMTGAQNAGRVEAMHDAEDMGIKVKKLWIATLDSRTRDTHAELDGQSVDVDEPFVVDGMGIMFPGDPNADPSLVYNCRCTLGYEYPDYKSSNVRRRDNETDDMIEYQTYSEWEKAKKGGAAPEDEEKKHKEEARQKLIDDIAHSHTVDQMTDEQKKEFRTVISDMPDEYLGMYRQMTDFHGNNNYKNGPGWYVPSRRRVEMTLKSNAWEKAVGRTESTGAWKTKYHEELHQLDHLLGISQGYGQYSDITYAVDDIFYGKPTPIGKRLAEAIRGDIIDFTNKGIDNYNEWLKKSGIDSDLKHITDLDKPIKKDVKNAFFNYLSDVVSKDGTENTTKNRALLSAFTDAVGLATGGRMNAYAEGYWGHKASYQKERGINGATSECFAEIGSHILRNDEEALGALEKVMPKSVEEYKKVFKELAEYMKNNTLSY